MQKIRRGDLVQIISGNEIGTRGEVKEMVFGWRVDRNGGGKVRNQNGDRVIVTGVNIRKKHQKRVSQTRTQTGIIEVEGPVHVSNVMLVCPSCDEATRVGIQFEEDRKVRFCKRCEAIID